MEKARGLLGPMLLYIQFSIASLFMMILMTILREELHDMGQLHRLRLDQ